jgi:exodeoxyribonuclease X
MSAVILDTETTGTTDEDKIIEFALTERMGAPPQLSEDVLLIPLRSFRYSSERPIALGAMATHHIIEDDLQGFPPFIGWDPLVEGIEYIVGHNVDFDWRMLGRPKVRRICTLALARSLWPDIDSHSLGAMVYHLLSDKQLARRMVKGAHSAEADIRMILDVLLPEIQIKLLPRGATWADLWEISEEARIPKVMPFGKHKGVPLGDVPGDYKRWLMSQPDVDPYLKVALRGR